MLRVCTCLVLFVLLATFRVSAQDDGTLPEYPADTTDYYPVDTTDNYMSYDTTTYTEDDFNQPPTSSDFTPRSGLFGGPTIEFTTLDPHKLDPDLSGDMVMYGGEGFVLINGWMFGGGGIAATLYDISPKYDQFAYGYGGFLTGYDFNIVKPFSFRIDLMIGAGGVTMIKKRADLTGLDSTGHDILERYRSENFFMLRPGASLGFSPLPFLDFRLGANYIFPVGGSKVSDLKNVAFGLQLLFGFGG